MSLIHRITMFKLNGADKQKKLLAAYETLAKENNKASVMLIQSHSPVRYSTQQSLTIRPGRQALYRLSLCRAQ